MIQLFFARAACLFFMVMGNFLNLGNASDIKISSLDTKDFTSSFENPHVQELSGQPELSVSHNENTMYSIDSIHDLIELVSFIRQKDPQGEIIIAYDWDNTISRENGSHLPFREKGLTARVIEQLFECYHAQFFILTARFMGEPAEKILIDACKNAKCMHDALPILGRTSIMNDHRFPYGFFPIADTNREAFFYKGVLFAGAEYNSPPVKGRALRQLAEGQEFFLSKSKDQNLTRKLTLNFEFDHLIFVDNHYPNVESAQKAFEDYAGKGKLYCVLYEQEKFPDSNELIIEDTSESYETDNEELTEEEEIEEKNMIKVKREEETSDSEDDEGKFFSEIYFYKKCYNFKNGEKFLADLFSHMDLISGKEFLK